MMEFTDALSALHLLRPWWCLLLPLIALLWWWWRRRTTHGGASSKHIAPHLDQALRVGSRTHRRFTPIDSLALLLVFLVLGAAGPTWSRIPNPMVTQTAPLVVVLKVSEDMLAQDIPPSRLERARHKIEDLLETRSGASTALIAYAGSAHQAVPLTDDPGLIRPYLEGLAPDVMPEPGDAAADALAMAEDLLADSPVPGAILFVTDGISTANRTAFINRDAGSTLVMLRMAPPNQATPVMDEIDAEQVDVSADGSDVAHLERLLAAAYQRALLDDDRLAWKDRGALMAIPALLLALLWFRRGWIVGTPVLLAPALLAPALLIGVSLAGMLTAAPVMAQQDATVTRRAAEQSTENPVISAITHAFLTPDQQGRWWMEHRDFDRAAQHFQDPAWQGYAMYRDGQYAEAAQLLGRLDTADAAFTQGLALIKSRQYRPAIDAFQTVLERDPDYPEGERNLALARQILDYVEETREQSDTGEEAGIGADEVVFDNESNRGEETQQTGDQEGGVLTADQWISALDTDTGDYLRQRFAVEAARGGQ
ncbi:transporter [Halomonas cupida]|uniref:Ca-activated chloride channel family protein n=1 Tax=Halomonas cupida TaxID=44933 RepID=A0A1M7EV43_9GAMM|nr:VWA domain-containing protein [Halomonas cupida]GEN23278.1 transporter [Halomonas cupida]SHL95705.1 Ca-activated chloride channel family protein [Halomonas cupida]